MLCATNMAEHPGTWLYRSVTAFSWPISSRVQFVLSSHMLKLNPYPAKSLHNRYVTTTTGCSYSKRGNGSNAMSRTLLCQMLSNWNSVKLYKCRTASREPRQMEQQMFNRAPILQVLRNVTMPCNIGWWF
jgi:hypothetical protein